MQQKVRERVGDDDKNIFFGAVMGSSTCPHVILCVAANVGPANVRIISRGTEPYGFRNYRLSTEFILLVLNFTKVRQKTAKQLF